MIAVDGLKVQKVKRKLHVGEHCQTDPDHKAIRKQKADVAENVSIGSLRTSSEKAKVQRWVWQDMLVPKLHEQLSSSLWTHIKKARCSYVELVM